jgi:hypothetical protein
MLTVTVKSKLIVGVKVLVETSIKWTTFVIERLEETAEVKPVELAVIVKVPVVSILISVIANSPETVFPEMVPVQYPEDKLNVIG